MELAGAARHRELVELDLAEVVEGHSDLVLLGTLVGWRHGVVIMARCVRAATATKRARVRAPPASMDGGSARPMKRCMRRRAALLLPMVIQSVFTKICMVVGTAG